jgi:hypothetical protein
MTNVFLAFEMSDGSTFQTCFGTTPVNDDAWHFVAVAVDRGDPEGIRLYVDGLLDQSCDPTGVTGSLANLDPVFFGGDPLSPGGVGLLWWDGVLDEIEIFRRSLLPGQIADLYVAGDDGKCPLPLACEESTGNPVCEGSCPAGFTCVTGPPPAEPCECVPEAAACEGSGPVCNGSCPDSGDVCVDVGGNCQCLPEPECVGMTPLPECDVPCPPGMTCTNNGQRCHCVTLSIACGDTFYPECNGSCPPGETCQNVVGTNACDCGPEPRPCDDPLYPVCDGSCPAGEACKQEPGPGCGCIACDTTAPDPPVVISMDSGQKVRWTPVTCALVYNLYRGAGPALADGDADGLADDYGSCHIGDVVGTEVVDPASPQPGAVFWYLVTAENFAGESTLGTNSSGQGRQPTAACD